MRILRGTELIVIVLVIARVISVYALARMEHSSTRVTLQRVMHLIIVLVILVIATSIIFVNWYGALAALGIGKSPIAGLVPVRGAIARIRLSELSSPANRQVFRFGSQERFR
jgi:hypothetical protein